MNSKPKQRMMHLLLPFLLAAVSAHAADTDVYLNQNSVVKPNVVFSIDTSGSMAWATNATPSYSPTNTYSGVFNNNNWYISVDGRIPSSTDGIANGPRAALAGCNFIVSDTGSYGFAQRGFTSVRAAVAFPSSSTISYSKNRWAPATKVYFSTTRLNDLMFECNDDSGIHGKASGTGGKYAHSNPTNTGNLYTSAASSEIDWDKFPYVTIYSGHYLNYKKNPPANISMSRRELQERVVIDAILRTPDIMAGFARMWGVRGGAIVRAAKDNSVRSYQQDLITTVNANSVAYGATPLATLLLDIMHYFHGKQVNRTSDYFHGGTSFPANWPRGYPGVPTDSDAHTYGKYNSPIEFECQKNYVILVTDGEPSWDEGANDDFRASNAGLYPDYTRHTSKNYCSGNCLDELGGYMSKADASLSLGNNYDLDGDSLPDPQTVKVYPIGMESPQTILGDTARAAGTESYYASNASEFESAFIDILANIKANAGVSMVTASSSSDRFSKTSNRDFLYYGQFVPSNNFQWQGNLKKYRVAYKANGTAYLTDTNEATNPEITNADGSFINTARSYWSASADGSKALEGGVAAKLDNNRLIRGLNTDAAAIMTDNNKISLTNPAFTRIFNTSGRTAAERQDIVNYALGKDVKDVNNNGVTSEQRGHIGGIVRSSPVAVQYGGTAADPEIAIFALTTDGMLHAFNDEDGSEMWAIMMREAYPHLSSQYDNYYSTNPWWGIDGALNARVYDKNENGKIESGDRVVLTISGGLSSRNWYMVDVTNAMKPSNQARLIKRTGYVPNSANYGELGLAISKMETMTYRIAGDAVGVTRKALVHANGWDSAAEFSYAESTMGRGLSLYDANNGNVLWQMAKGRGGTNMDFAFATQPTVVDLDGDGLTDLIYALDVNARLWRFNVDNNASTTRNMISGDILANFGGTVNSIPLHQRRTYKKADAAVISTPEGNQVLLAIGTGDRMNPLSETTQDRLIVLTDKTASSGTDPAAVLRFQDLYNATANTVGQGSDASKATAATTLNSKSGWYINLPTGTQKSISAPLISSGIVNFPVYEIGGTNTNPCENSDAGQGYLYRMNVLDATPAADYDGDGNLSSGDRYMNIRGGGIPGDAGLHTSSSGQKSIVVGIDFVPANPDALNPEENADDDVDFGSGAAGYWFEGQLVPEP